MTLSLTVFDNQKQFLSFLQKNVDFPTSITVVDSANDVFKDKEGKEHRWGHLYAVDTNLYEKCESIGLPEACPKFTIKLRNYSGEDLSHFHGAEIHLTDYQLVFQLDKFRNPVGFALSTELESIEELVNV